MHYNTHVFAIVRIKVDGTNCADEPEMVAKDVAEAIAKSSEEWMEPRLGYVDIDGAGSFKISAVEFDGEVNWTMVDELECIGGDVIREHHFDFTGERMIGRSGFVTAREARLDAEVELLRNQVAALTGTKTTLLAGKALSAGDVMNKNVSVGSLSEIVEMLLRCPDAVGELDDERKYRAFLAAVAQVVCDHCGGEISNLPTKENNWHTGIRGNDSLPEGSQGIWQYEVIPAEVDPF